MHWDKKVIEWYSIKPITQQWRISIDMILHRDTDIYLSSISEKGWKENPQHLKKFYHLSFKVHSVLSKSRHPGTLHELV